MAGPGAVHAIHETLQASKGHIHTLAPRGAHTVDWNTLRKIRAALERQNEEPMVTSEQIAACWEEVAEASCLQSGCPPLQPRDREFIATRVTQSMHEVDPKYTNKVDRDRWVHHMLLTRSNPQTMRAMFQVTGLLEAAICQCPGMLVALQHAFEALDSADVTDDIPENPAAEVPEEAPEEAPKDVPEEAPERPEAEEMPQGSKRALEAVRLPVAEVVEIFGRKLWHLRPRTITEDCSSRPGPAFLHESISDFVSSTISLLDIEPSTLVTGAEFLALCTGRRERQVTLHLYDLSKGLAKKLSPVLVNHLVEGVWHTGLVVYGREYYFGGDIYYDTPAMTGFGKPRRAILLGSTLRQREELHEFIVDQLKPLFTRAAYCAARNNCNHFTDRVSMYLLGKHIPDEILQQPKLMMQSRLGRSLRPLLTRWLGLYFEAPLTAAEVEADGKSPGTELNAMDDNSNQIAL
eukprot:CAMPEP_0170605720 /NCGR_PEP_ID=MMETSP0224-20130122/20123_1 /TAXON_ID=285029 /ORGANISM="Togula jolla, Strain CCCM 725" /LENGTH=462 /DNA_ID=CAMNT_0010930741 /DNA_START=109 /DNA_END=1497 /DNA_ORIENTATION=+